MKFNAKAVLGIAVSLVLLWWALRDVSFAEVAHEIRSADPVLFLLSVAVATSGLAIRALRWEVLLRPAAPGVPFRPRYAATSVGFAANNLLPARVGEFARAFALGRLGGVPITAALASIVVERVLDGLVIVGLLFASMAVSSFPAGDVAGVDPRAAARVLALATGVFGLLLFLLATMPERSVAVAERVAGWVLPQSLRRPLVDALHSFLGGLGVLRDPKLLVLSLFWALGQWLFLALSFFLAFRAFGIDQVPFSGAVFLQSLISLAVSIPSSPGFFGPWEAGAKVGLALWGVPDGQAISFAIGFHIGGFIPVTLIGLWYVWRLNLRWKEVEASEETVEEIVERDEVSSAPAPRR
ncbi:MAG TPA: lysylphosphatidylglycerol synthase transmembrane domain-containing protein [Longimicrobiaceae bacterium]|nr:lysylphosphatidylglycerol synthase transmembrane domain-containing protein [Longimicrobiaceae bacterium]